MLARALGLGRSNVAYVESIARTRRFSLSATLLYHLRLADVLFVQVCSTWKGSAPGLIIETRLGRCRCVRMRARLMSSGRGSWVVAHASIYA
jgi:hypothetical protein